MASKEYELAIRIAGKVDSSLGRSTTETTNNLNAMQKATKGFSTVAAVSFAAIAAGAIIAGKALLDLGCDFDEAYDTIAIKTGATGDQLTALENDFKAVYGSVPTTMENASAAVSAYNQVLNLQGDALQGVSEQAIQVADMLGEDLTGVVDSSATAFAQWNLSSDKMGGAMDYVFAVSQQTGLGFTDLMGDMQTYGAQLQELGFSFEDSAAMLGQVRAAGYDTSAVMIGMKAAVKNLAAEGINTTDGLQSYYTAIMNAGTETEAITKATEVFGSKAGSTMAAAIRSGALSVDDFTASLEANGATISGTAESTYDFAERLQLFKQKAQLAFEPMAATLFDSLNDIMPAVSEALVAIMPAIEELTPVIASVISTVAPLVAEALPGIIDGVTSLVTTVLPPLTAAFQWVIDNWTIIEGALIAIAAGYAAFQIVGVITGLVTAMKAWAVATEGVSIAQKILNVVMSGGVLGIVIAAVAALVAAFIYLWNNCDAFRNFWIGLWDGIKSVVAGIGAWFSTVFTGAWEGIKGAFSAVGSFFASIWATITGIFTSIGTAVGDAIGGAFKAVVNAIIGFAESYINGFISAINLAIGVINAIPGVNIPVISQLAIPRLADGGIATSATLAMIGEGNESEAVLPLSKLSAMLDTPTKNNSTSDEDCTVVFAPVQNFYGPVNRDDVDAANAASFEQFKRYMNQYDADRKRKSFA